ncbi:MAG TPA: hypothetical protein VEG40_01745 [Gaiellaceae bacterium]|nr:hypothetical protein [Gaiellaceae bacterium]
MDDADQPKSTISARIPVALARDLARIAEEGNRTVSREIWAACAEHVRGCHER